MATFPGTIPWDMNTDIQQDLGVTSVVMDDGEPHNQTHYDNTTTEWATYRVNNDMLTLAEVDLAVGFLRANSDLEFDALDPGFQRSYTGRLVNGSVTTKPAGGGRWNVAWDWRAKRV